MMRPLLTAEQHLALYTAFHRALGNKRVHAVCVPLILLTGAIFLAYLGDPRSALLHAGTLVVVVVCAILACIDSYGALALSAWLLPLSGLAGTVVGTMPMEWVLPLAASVHVGAWILTVSVGHTWIEPVLESAGTLENSNLYFRSGYFMARSLGCPVSPIDSMIQFNIAPLSLTHDVLLLLGLRREQEQHIARQRELVLQRLHCGQAPFATGIRVAGR
jgi:uncharacterized membrane protein YGL010W